MDAFTRTEATEVLTMDDYGAIRRARRDGWSIRRIAKTLGMVNQVVKREELESYTLAMAEKIAKRPSMGLKLAKMSVNQSLDAQGMWTAVQSAFALHHLGHTNSLVKHGIRVEPTGVKMIRDGARSAKAAAE